MTKILDILSVLGSFLIVFSLLFLVQNLTFGNIPAFRSIIVFKVFHLKDLIFTATSLTFISRYVTIEVPRRGRRDHQRL